LCERRLARRRGAREAACTGVATMPQLSILRLILNAAAWLPRESDFALQSLIEGRAGKTELVQVVGIPVAVKCASVPRWACRKRRRRNSRQGAGSGQDDFGSKVVIPKSSPIRSQTPPVQMAFHLPLEWHRNSSTEVQSKGSTVHQLACCPIPAEEREFRLLSRSRHAPLPNPACGSRLGSLY
jgi:hypothetical protein